MSRLEDALERAIVGAFVDGFDRRARAIRAKVGDAIGAEAVMRRRVATDLEGCAAAVATLLPADPPERVTLLPPGTGEPTA